MFSFLDLDGHPAGKTQQLTGARVRYNGDSQLRLATCHGAAMLEGEGAAAAVQRAADPLDGDVAGRAFDAGTRGQHLSLADAFDVTVKLFVDRHPAEGRVLGLVVRELRR